MGVQPAQLACDAHLWAQENARIGAQIIGRRMSDFGVEPWGDDPRSTHRCSCSPTDRRTRIDKRGGTGYTFVTDGIASAVEQAKVAADRKDVLISGGLSVAQQALAAGLVDELSLHVAPVLIGAGARLLDAIGPETINLELNRLTGSPAVTHLLYNIAR